MLAYVRTVTLNSNVIIIFHASPKFLSNLPNFNDFWGLYDDHPLGIPLVYLFLLNMSDAVDGFRLQLIGYEPSPKNISSSIALSLLHESATFSG